ncbi:MAG: MFS transporter [Promethearchaeota archaeon]|nr:MAG: MFS transporter [Candidatus Lokiarchaeota archaeon]
MRKREKKTAKSYPELNALWLGLFVDILGFYLIIPFLPSFIDEFNTTPFVIGLLLATNAVFTLFFAPLWGKISDRIGRKPVLIISQMGTFIAFLMLAFSSTLEMLFVARIVDGIFGGNYPMVKAIISDTVPPKDRGVQMTNLGVVHVLAGLIGPGMGGVLSIIQILGSNYPVATAGLAAAGLSFTTICITIFFIKESWPKEKRLKAEKEIKVKIKIRENKDATYLLTQYAFHTISFTMYIATLTIFLGIILGLNAFEIGILLTISGIFRAIMRFTVFKPTLRLLGERTTTKMGLLIVVITFFLVGFVRNIWEIILLMLVVSYGISCCRGLLISGVTQSVRPNEMGKVNGYITTLDSLAQIIGPIIGTLILSFYDPVWFGVTMSLIALGAFIMIFKQIIPLHLKDKEFEMEELIE